MNLKKYITGYSIYSVTLFLLTFLFNKMAPEHLASQANLFMVPFFLFLVVGSKIIITSQNKRNAKLTSSVILSISTGRFFLYLAILLVYSMNFRSDAVAFIIWFFVFYLLFTAPEVYLNYKSTNRLKKQL
jgi:hypothetical protein